jgi:hypothetical protein
VKLEARCSVAFDDKSTLHPLGMGNSNNASDVAVILEKILSSFQFVVL